MRIVVVEDEIMIRNGLKKTLPKLDQEYRVVGTAENGEEGLALITETLPDLVILDIRMPRMDGLSMLKKLREAGVACKAVVLTAYSDFSYAKEAITLGIENYLLKPIKIPELTETLEIIDRGLKEERGKAALQERLLSLEQIFRGCLLAELPVDEELNRVTCERYGLDVGEPLGLYCIWLGRHFEEAQGQAVQILESYAGKASDYVSMILPSLRYRMVIAILYHMEDPVKIRKRYGETVTPAVSHGLSCTPVCSWGMCGGMQELSETVAHILEVQKWNLSLPEGSMICREQVEGLEPAPLKYSLDTEAQIKQALTDRSEESFTRVLDQFRKACVGKNYSPDEIREACVRFCLAVLTLAESVGRVKGTVSTRTLIGEISQAVTWNHIFGVLRSLYGTVSVDDQEEEMSLLVKRARKVISEYYNQGITLEEVAQKLCVSEEYLSTQFKKETGMSFTETVRKCRIDKIKELLLHSGMKLNQIADMVGYSDPKYMSKVFREEVGVLPAEFRKNNS